MNSWGIPQSGLLAGSQAATQHLEIQRREPLLPIERGCVRARASLDEDHPDRASCQFTNERVEDRAADTASLLINGRAHLPEVEVLGASPLLQSAEGE